MNDHRESQPSAAFRKLLDAFWVLFSKEASQTEREKSLKQARPWAKLDGHSSSRFLLNQIDWSFGFDVALSIITFFLFVLVMVIPEAVAIHPWTHNSKLQLLFGIAMFSFILRVALRIIRRFFGNRVDFIARFFSIQNSNDAISGIFLGEKEGQAQKVSIYAVALALAFPFAFDDYVPSFLLMGFVCILWAYLLIIRFRVARGFYGSNAEEARELINFIISKASKGDPPSSTRVSVSLEEGLAKAPAESGAQVGQGA
jgi:hypothetical protein